VIILFGAIISAHQVAFMIKTGRKAALVSSIDGNSLNTRWSNLQEGRAEKFTAHVPKFTVRISENLQKISIENP
jgi:hypothetical protein